MRLVGFYDDDIVALIEDAAGGGDPSDPAAPRNAPAITPESYLDKVGWHADFFQYERLIDDIITVNHASLAGASTTLGNSSPHFSLVVQNNTRVTDIPLYTHSLGYKPICFVQYDGINLISGTEVQRDATGRYRLVSMYVTDTVVGIREIAYASNVDLSAASRDYRVGICRNPEADEDLPLFGTVDGHVVLGRGKINTANKYARLYDAADAEEGFKLDLERTVDIRSGGRRVVSGGVTSSEPAYSGSFTGGGFVEIGFA